MICKPKFAPAAACSSAMALRDVSGARSRHAAAEQAADGANSRERGVRAIMPAPFEVRR
jgi:hypothetical protein